MEKSDIGMIGLAVMGSNLALNMESKGFGVSVFDREQYMIDDFVKAHPGKNFYGPTSLQDFVASLKAPRKIMMMIKAGQPVDDYIEKLCNMLEPGDIIIDGGNTHFPDTERRMKYVESKGLLYIGTGVSGGEEGALKGPSMMPGGSVKAWPEVKGIFQAICAKVDSGDACCDWVGEGGAGHFVKMVHNGIEYGDIQLICECYSFMKNILGMDNAGMQTVFAEWNKGAFDKDPEIANIMLDPFFAEKLAAAQVAWRNIICTAVRCGLPVPCLSAGLEYYDGYRCSRLPANLLQAQRDFFGAHTYERNDAPRGKFFHTVWKP